MKKVAINGFGRIGRTTLKTILANKKSDIEVVAVNDLTSPTMLAHLFKYDTAYGNFKGAIEIVEDGLKINGKLIKISAEKDPAKLPWKALDIDLVIEATGFFRTKELASKHLQAGAKKVLISAPVADLDVPTIVFGVNENIIKANDQIISAASCTTNALAPLARALHEEFDLTKGLCTTIHGYTADQRIQDAPHSDLRRARAAAQNMIPTTSGAAKAVAKVIPELKGRLDALAIRVPIITGSVVDLTFALKAQPSIKEINAAIKKYESASFAYTTDPIVSSDIIGHTAGSIFDSSLTSFIDGTDGTRLYKTISWYDNEASYVNQLVRTIIYITKLMK